MRLEIVFLLEEDSAKAMLQNLAPRIRSNEAVQFRYITFEGKQDLERNLVVKIKKYQNRNARFIILRDQDSTPDCKQLKQKLLILCEKSGRLEHCVVRIACKELESFYLADLKAVAHALELEGIERHQNSKKYRTPDKIESPSKELKRLTKNRYEKVKGSSRIGKTLDTKNIRSPSFRALVEAIQRLERDLVSA